ncbi:class I SAM-dependent methyltransferase [Paenibacillus elgii]|uniref:class I SAM-dependent methyltransferase n=1 Tax=Paenibacillus elgii TaxID=189691 RepID=UPI0013D48876|nr:class I SAM-dependent methyltransferase [Paenibacillus elgii]
MSEEVWHAFFGSDYLTFSEVILSPERTRFEVQRILELLDLPPAASILDLGCGQGRIAVPLAQMGYRVTGYDGSSELLEAARRRAAEAGADVNFLHGDMRDLDFDEEFDAVLNVGTAFGYIADEEGDRRILNRVRLALKPGGSFLQETENRDYKLQGLRNTWNEMNGRPVFSERQFDSVSGRWTERIFWFEGSEKKGTVLNVRLYAATELIAMTRNAGLQVTDVFGGFDFSPLKADSPRMLILSKKEQSRWRANM